VTIVLQGPEPAATDHLGFSRQAHALGIREALGFAAGPNCHADIVTPTTSWLVGFLRLMASSGAKSSVCAAQRPPLIPTAVLVHVHFGGL